MRVCNKCKIKTVRSESQYTCKDCHNEYQKSYYKKNPTSINTSHTQRKQQRRSIVIQAKNTPCIDCNKSYPYYVMDLDHVRGQKKFNISIAGNKMFSERVILEEIAKCDVVCANCHRERTFSRKDLLVE